MKERCCNHGLSNRDRRKAIFFPSKNVGQCGTYVCLESFLAFSIDSLVKPRENDITVKESLGVARDK